MMIKRSMNWKNVHPTLSLTNHGQAAYSDRLQPPVKPEGIPRVVTENDLLAALEQGEFVVHYQPIVALATGARIGYEALVRWLHPQRGLVYPGEFIPMAEEIGLVGAIDRWVMWQACEQLRSWQREGKADDTLAMHVNVSAQQFMEPQLVTDVAAILRTTGIGAHQIKLEITEGVFIDDPPAAIATLRQLKAMGVQLSLDDFGTGFSSLSWLHAFPVDTLKIDRSFVIHEGESAKHATILAAIVMLAHQLGLTVVAEGIETEAQRVYVNELGCEYGQGYLFAKPMSAIHVVERRM